MIAETYRLSRMKILVVGANGRVGTKLVHLLAADHTVYAGARHTDLPNHVHIDLTSPLPEITAAVESVQPDVIYFTAGSRGKNLLQVDAFGAVKLTQAAQAAGVRRFVMLSTVYALQPERWNESFLANLSDYYIAKFFADHWLVHHSALDYTILQPGTLEETPGTGKIAVDVSEPRGNSMDDVAATLAQIITVPGTVGKVITMSEGTTPIAEALATI